MPLPDNCFEILSINDFKSTNFSGEPLSDVIAVRLSFCDSIIFLTILEFI